MVSKASEDLPEPESPVNTISRSRGSSSDMFFRLCSRAPWIDMTFFISAIATELDQMVNTGNRHSPTHPHWARGPDKVCQQWRMRPEPVDLGWKAAGFNELRLIQMMGGGNVGLVVLGVAFEAQ